VGCEQYQVLGLFASYAVSYTQMLVMPGILLIQITKTMKWEMMIVSVMFQQLLGSVYHTNLGCV